MVQAVIAPDRYHPRKLLEALRNPWMIRNECNRLGLEANRAYYRRRDHDGIDVPAADWDVLVILDACRYDLFAEAYDPLVDGRTATLRQVTSRGSHSREFLRANFGDDDFHETVYVSANPFVYRNADGVFHAVRNLLSTDWDEQLGTVRPETVAQTAIDCLDAYPRKRLIVHFMQPHFPFIGERGQKLDQYRLNPDDVRRVDGEDAQIEISEKTVWAQLQAGELSRERVWECYRENLEVALPHVQTVLEAADGKAVVTADHGNLLGEHLWPVPVRGYGHPEGIHVPELVDVPWLEFPSDQRPSIVAEAPETGRDANELSEEAVEERLAHLGYR